MNLNQLRNQHLWWRAGFGPPADQVHLLAKQKPESLFHSILKASEKKPNLFDLADPELKEIMERGTTAMMKMPVLSAQEKQIIRQQSVQDIASLNIRWLQEMAESPAQLREKMALFWHGHFATRTVNIIYDQALLNTIRENALGNFRDLLIKVSKSASMIQFLNTNQNRKDHPNENFARELMELFTIGRGHYTETDIRESARAFTGWGMNLQGEYVFRPRQHDDGIKTFFSKTGNFSGEDILDILLEQKQTAVFLTRKIYRYFVNEAVDEERVDELSTVFFKSGYDISLLLENIFTAPWFYAPENIGIQIKSPVLWLVGMRRQLPMEIQNPLIQLALERLLGQVLFAPPNVAGWPGGKHWIDSSSLMLRMQIPQIISRSDFIASNPKDDDDQMMGMRDRTLAQNIRKLKNPGIEFFRTEILWPEYLKNFEKVQDPALYATVCGLLLQRELLLDQNAMSLYMDGSGRDKEIQSLTIRVMGTPEYQLC